ncbi:hypothetical protein HQ585_15390 [candidate division KSB1 bacterium]|nr:hypothetical protein [candidate division KSB1 bacterium]
MKERTHKIIPVLIITLFSSTVFSQMAGNPAGVKGNGKLTLSVSGTYLNQVLVTETAVSKRILGKCVWGATSKIDLFITMGSVGLKMQSEESGVSDYEDKKRFAIGFGLNVELASRSKSSPYSIWVNAKTLRFESSGTYYIYDNTGNSEWQSDFTYDWREAQVTLCAKYYFPTFNIYGGVLGWMLQRHDEKMELSGGQLWGPERQTYQSGMWTGALVGMEFPLPYEYSFSVEAVFFNAENYQIMVGFTQTGLQ